MRSVKLPSGAILRVAPATFSESKALYQAMLVELKALPFSSKSDVSQIIKDIFCAGFSSSSVDLALSVCMSRCLYNDGTGDTKLEESCFEPAERRQDYLQVCAEVTKENILPFAKNLYADFQKYTAMVAESFQA